MNPELLAYWKKKVNRKSSRLGWIARFWPIIVQQRNLGFSQQSTSEYIQKHFNVCVPQLEISNAEIQSRQLKIDLGISLDRLFNLCNR